VSDACGCAEDLAGDEFQFPMGSPGALARKLERLYQQRSRESPRRLPSVDDSVVAILKAYSDIGK
jgi:hypothetical protein